MQLGAPEEVVGARPRDGSSCASPGVCQQMAINVIELQSKTHF